MYSKRHLILSPMKVQENEILTVHSDTGSFQEKDYMITNEAGRIIRKGVIASNLTEFKLRIVGLQRGVYRLVMGQHQEKFIVF